MLVTLKLTKRTDPQKMINHLESAIKELGTKKLYGEICITFDDVNVGSVDIE